MLIILKLLNERSGRKFQCNILVYFNASEDMSKNKDLAHWWALTRAVFLFLPSLLPTQSPLCKPA